MDLRRLRATFARAPQKIVENRRITQKFSNLCHFFSNRVARYTEVFLPLGRGGARFVGAWLGVGSLETALP